MSVSNASNLPSTAGATPTLTAAATAPEDQELSDWNIYYQMLRAGKLDQFGGE